MRLFLKLLALELELAMLNQLNFGEKNEKPKYLSIYHDFQTVKWLSKPVSSEDSEQTLHWAAVTMEQHTDKVL